MAGECICCQALFDQLRKVAAKYGVDLEKLLEELELFVREGTENPLERRMEQ